MFKRLASLQWKSFFRSSSLGKSMALKVVMIFFGAYILVSLIAAGGGLYFALRKFFPHEGPMWSLSKYMIYWVFFELLIRYFMQKLPVMDIKPLLILPIKKFSIAHYILGRSAVSFYNMLSLAFFVPYTIVLLWHGYPVLNVLVWMLGVFALMLWINYTNFLINKSTVALGILVSTILLFYGLDYFKVLSLPKMFQPIFHALYAYPITVFFPMGLALLAYYLNFRYIDRNLYLDAALKGKNMAVEASNLSWTNKFGQIGPFLQLDLRLIWRNKRTKSQVFVSLLLGLYGLLFYTQKIYADMVPMQVFLGLFMTGIFLSNFGQFIPAWDSSYYSMLMSQNIPMRRYLESKAALISVSVVFMYLLTTPYVYFGWNILWINTACAIYNLGINLPVILYFGSFNKKRIELDQSPFGNMQGTSATQFLIMVPLFLAPIVLFSAIYYMVSLQMALIIISLFGIMGLLFRNYFMDRITEQYKRKKYDMIAGFKEKNN